MKAYITYFKLKFISGLQYRQAAYAGIVTQFFFGFVYIMVYIAFYKSGGKNIPMTLSQMVTYIWLGQGFLALINQYARDHELFKLVRDGGISYELTRPKNLYFMWYFKVLGQRLASVTLRVFPLLIITFILPSPYNFSLPSSFSIFIVFFISLFIGTLLITGLVVLYPIITLHTMNEKGIVNMIITISDILSGLIVPIPFFPLFLQKISKILPFQYISDLPFRIYVGNISIENGIYGIIIQLFWLIVIVLLGQVLLTKSMKKIIVQGG